ncbi:hypothetical protein [Vreelandella rituensis]|nr:hypothetical protein [Halomonas rituensis]
MSEGEGLHQAPLFDDSADDTENRCRIPALIGLSKRKMPAHAGVFPQALCAWVSAMPASNKRFAEAAPCLYVHAVEGKPDHLIVPSKHNVAQVESCQRRFRLAKKQAVATGGGVGANQVILQPRHLNTLAYLLSGLKFPLPGTDVQISSVLGGRITMQCEPRPLIRRLGYAPGGSAYDSLEEDITTLARLLVVQERLEGGEWVAICAEPLIDYFDSGQVSVHGGVLQQSRSLESTKKRPSRLAQWRISIGQPLTAMLRCAASDLTVITHGLWRAAGRHVGAQWLTLFYAGHGYDRNNIHDYRIDTLSQLMRTCPDEFINSLPERDDQRAGKAVLDPWQPRVKEIGVAQRNDQHAVEREKQGSVHKGRQSAYRRVAASFAKLESHDIGGFAKADLVQPFSDTRRIYRGFDRYNVQRWAGHIELVRHMIPSSFDRTLLAALNRIQSAPAATKPSPKKKAAVDNLRRDVTLTLSQISQARAGSWWSQHLHNRLERASARRVPAFQRLSPVDKVPPLLLVI